MRRGKTAFLYMCLAIVVGIIEGDEEEIRFAWGAKSLPWLILTDKLHVVKAEGFDLDELNRRTK